MEKKLPGVLSPGSEAYAEDGYTACAGVGPHSLSGGGCRGRVGDEGSGCYAVAYLAAFAAQGGSYDLRAWRADQGVGVGVDVGQALFRREVVGVPVVVSSLIGSGGSWKPWPLNQLTHCRWTRPRT